MSKIYTLYKQLKKDNNSTIYLFKSGLFYISIADDAYYLSNKFGFKITKLNDTVSKCGFPVSSIEKYSKLFTLYSINYKIINASNNEIEKLIDKICNVDTERLSVSEAYKFIEDIKKEATIYSSNLLIPRS